MSADCSHNPPANPPLAPARDLRRTRTNRFAGTRLFFLLLIALALVPVGYVLWQTAEGRRDIVYWDEFDTALALVIKLKENQPTDEFLTDIFALNNEHRMVSSRLLYAAIYWLTGTINFTFLHWVGNAWILLLGGVLILAAKTKERRLRLGLLFAFLLFQLEHYENYLWSGSSIDHFLVVLLGAGALVALARGTRAGLVLGGVLAALTTFTLAQGIMVWPVGAAQLWHRKRHRHLAGWAAMGAIVIGSFLTGFRANTAQSFAALSFDGALQVLHYWLSILGAVPALGYTQLQPILGGVLIVLVIVVALRGGLRRETVNLPVVLFTAAAAGLIALGRTAESHGLVHSRYYVLSGVAWALTLFMLLERQTHPRQPWRPILTLLPSLLLFNVMANAAFLDETHSWLECRDRAVTRFTQHGLDGRDAFKLHPNPERSTALLRRAEELGVYRLGPICPQVPFPAKAAASERLAYFVDEMTVNARAVFLRGWVGIPGRPSRRGQIHLVLRSATATHLFATVSITRPDVAQATNQPGWKLAGFAFAGRRDRLPTGEFQVGFLTTQEGKPEYTMTAHRLHLVGEGQALLATGK